MICKPNELVYTFLAVFAMTCRGQPKKVKISFPLADAICYQNKLFGSTSALQPPLKKSIDSGKQPSFQGNVTWQDCNNSKNCRPFSFVSSAVSTVDSKLLEKLKNQQIANILVILKDSTVAKLNEIKARNLQSRAEKLNEAAKALQAFTANSQKNTHEVLNQHGRTKPLKTVFFWITNQIAVAGADLQLVQELANLPEISEIKEEFFIQMEPPVNLTLIDERDEKGGESAWGVQAIQAPQVWSQENKGVGITVGTVDTGVRGTHEALKDSFAGEYGWFDPTENKLTPYDSHGHGTHVTATIVGRTNNVGVAPGALWTSCKACNSDLRCSAADLTSCAQFMACPTKASGLDPKCEKAPHVVNNSWGSRPNELWYYDVIKYYHAVGIIPIFSIGNSGPGCSTATSPGDYDNVIGVGATTMVNQLWYYSSVGPPQTKAQLKPDVSAPGDYILSGWPSSDSSYAVMSGTSMACPHVSGAVALLLSKYPNLTYQQVKEALQGGCEPTVSTGANCGKVSEDIYPNYHVGYGRINVMKSMSVAASIK